jgi:hypothetical protein
MTIEELAKQERIKLSQAGLWAEWKQFDKELTRYTSAVISATRDHLTDKGFGTYCNLGPKCRADIARRAGEITSSQSSADR